MCGMLMNNVKMVSSVKLWVHMWVTGTGELWVA